LKASEPLSPALWADLAAFLGAEKVPFTQAELAAERAPLERALRRELARRLVGDTAAVRVALEGDPVLAKALGVLGRARTPREVFAVATEAPAGRRGVPAGR
jgi:hypothetical protein